MSTTWILIANSSQAAIYLTHKAKLFLRNGCDNNSLILVRSFSHQDSRKKTSDLISDRFGKYRFSGSNNFPAGHGAFLEPTDPKAHEADVFAQELVQTLDQGRRDGAYDDVVLIATPHFRGLLNKHLKHAMQKLVSKVIDKDYTHIKGRALARQLIYHL